MTYAYAAPEQIRGEPITTATDVYALGVILYELLTGDRPHRVSGDNPLSLLQAITETDAMAPSEWLHRRQTSTTTVAFHPRELNGDLDTIVLKALERDPARRYPSAQSLSDDLGRYLANLPIQARPASWRYRSAKWIRRNRLSAALAAGVAAVLLFSGIWVVRERNRAIEQARVAHASKQFLIDTFTAANRWATGREVTAVELTLRGLERVATSLKDYPEARIEMYDVLGHTLGRASPVAQGARARELQVAELRKLRPGSAQLVKAEFDLMHAYWFAEMLPPLQRQLAILERDYVDAMPPWTRVGMQTMRLDASRMQGDYATGLLAADALFAGMVGSRQRISGCKTSGVQHPAASRRLASYGSLRRGSTTPSSSRGALDLLRSAGRDLADRPAVQAHYTCFVVRHAAALTPDRMRRARDWIGAHFGEQGGFTLWMDLRLLDVALRNQATGEAQALYDRLEMPLQQYGEESLFELRDLYLLGAELALAQGNREVAADRWRRALERSRHSDAHLVFPGATSFESPFTRQALAGLAYLDVLAGQLRSELEAVAKRQFDHGDGAWRRSAGWLASLQMQAGERAQAHDRLVSILDWQGKRSADPDSRLETLFAGFSLKQHPRAGLLEAEQQAFDKLFDDQLTAGEQATAALRQVPDEPE
ncbi:MAG: protein kinase [Ahniella sp.]|nr:protein kinase [Ahniella sp.]